MVYEQNHIDLPTLEGVYKQLYAYGNYIDEVVYASCPGATYTMRRYLHDHLYSPAAIVYLTASNCIVVERSEYDAYGVAHYYNADYSQTFAISQHGNPFAFTGREIDSFDFASGVSQLIKMHYRHRDYSPFMGRFYQQDPLGVNPSAITFYDPLSQYHETLNTYEYVKTWPISGRDPFGLKKGEHKERLSACLRTGCKGSCGPDITIAFSRMVENVRKWLNIEFVQDPSSKSRICGFGSGIYSTDGWDINEAWEKIMFTDGQRTWPEGKYCWNMVTLAGKCVNIWELNYFMWGVVNKECGESKTDILWWAQKWAANRPDDPGCKVAFADAGYEGNINDPISLCDMSSCCSVNNVPLWNEILTFKVKGSKYLKGPVDR